MIGRKTSRGTSCPHQTRLISRNRTSASSLSGFLLNVCSSRFAVTPFSDPVETQRHQHHLQSVKFRCRQHRGTGFTQQAARHGSHAATTTQAIVIHHVRKHSWSKRANARMEEESEIGPNEAKRQESAAHLTETSVHLAHSFMKASSTSDSGSPLQCGFKRQERRIEARSDDESRDPKCSNLGRESVQRIKVEREIKQQDGLPRQAAQGIR